MSSQGDTVHVQSSAIPTMLITGNNQSVEENWTVEGGASTHDTYLTSSSVHEQNMMVSVTQPGGFVYYSFLFPLAQPTTCREN